MEDICVIGKGRVKFKSLDDFDKYIQFYSENMGFVRKCLKSVLEKHNYKEEVHAQISSFLKQYMDTFFDANGRATDFVTPISAVNSYISQNNTWYRLLSEYEDLSVIAYGKYIFIIIQSADYLIKEYDKDYSDISLSELKQLALIEEQESNSLMISATNVKLSEVKATEQKMNQEVKIMEETIKNITDNGTPEFQKMQDEINKQLEIVKKMEQELDVKKQAMLAEMNKIKEKMMAKVNDMKKKIQILSDQIYTIQCYMGETFELFQIRNGEPASIDRPIIFLQKMRYLDEDLAQLFSLYSDDIDAGSYKIIEELLKYNDIAVEQFVPYEKCISFFKVSKDNRTYGNIAESNILKSFDMLHGQKVGFIIRNGGNLYIGYTDEEKITLYDDVFLRPQIKIDGTDDSAEQKSTAYSEVASRIFSFAILQGILENGEIVKIPKPHNIFNPGNYIVFSYADNTIAEKKFGDLGNLVRNLNKKSKVGNTILVLQSLAEHSYKVGISERGREDSYQNRTHDCHLENGINNINLIDEHGQHFVSVRKQNSPVGATANFRVETEEFIDLTYMNSEWVRYYLSSKDIGSMIVGSNYVNYAYFAKYLKMALDYLKKREVRELNAIKEFYPFIEGIYDWQVVLSHWKLINEVRDINVYQAKRFAKYLEEGKIKFVTHLFDAPYRYVNKINQFGTRTIKGLNRNSCRQYGGHIGSTASKEEISKAINEDINKAIQAKNLLLDEMKNLGYDFTYQMFLQELEGHFEKSIGYKLKDIFYKEYTAFINEDLSFKPYVFEKEFIEAMFKSSLYKFEHFLKEENSKQKEFLEIYYLNELIDLYSVMFDIIHTYEKERHSKACYVKKIETVLL